MRLQGSNVHIRMKAKPWTGSATAVFHVSGVIAAVVEWRQLLLLLLRLLFTNLEWQLASPSKRIDSLLQVQSSENDIIKGLYSNVRKCTIAY